MSKVRIVPYLVNNDNWMSAIDFYNHSKDSQTIEITIQYWADGKQVTPYRKNIGPYRHFILGMGKIRDMLKNQPNGNEGRFTLIMKLPDGVMETPFMFNGNGGYGIANSVSVDTLGK